MNTDGKQGRGFLVPALTFVVGFVVCLCLFYFTNRAASRSHPSDQASSEPAGGRSDTFHETEYIGQETAVSIAYANAGVSAEDASLLKVSFDRENGQNVYDIEFQAGAFIYDYDINALTGEVLNYDAESKSSQGPGGPAVSPETPAAASAASNTDLIGEEAAKAAALEHAGFQESDVVYINVWLDYDDGRPEHYDVEFLVSNTEYEYEIDLYSDTVLSQSMENYDHTPGSHQSAHQDNVQGGNPAANGTDIGAESAKSIALTHAQLDASQVTRLKAEYDIDNGNALYEVEFKYNGYEYEYEINAATGEIIKYKIDDD